VIGIILKLEIHQRNKNGGIQTGKVWVMTICCLLVITDAISVGMALKHRVAGIINSTKEGRTYLAYTPSHTLNCFIAQDDGGFRIAIFEADITQLIRHGENPTRRNEQAMKSGGCRLNILHPIRSRSSKIGSVSINQFRDPQICTAHPIRDSRWIKVKNQSGFVFSITEVGVNGINGSGGIQLATDHRRG